MVVVIVKMVMTMVKMVMAKDRMQAESGHTHGQIEMPTPGLFKTI